MTNSFLWEMDQGKNQKIGKSLIENGTIVLFTDLLKYLPQNTIAKGMGIHTNTLPKRMEAFGNITLDNLIQLAESFEVDPMKVVDIAAKERIQQRAEEAKKGQKRK